MYNNSNFHNIWMLLEALQIALQHNSFNPSTNLILPGTLSLNLFSITRSMKELAKA